MIDVQSVSKRYGKILANDTICMQVGPGELAVLLGPNGAGKSTLIKSICGLLRFEGRISIQGYDNKSIDAKRLLGYVPEIPVLYNMLTVQEHLEFIAKAYSLQNWQSRAQNMLERFELADKANKLGHELSKGMQQKVSICCALLPQPQAVIFDEPFVGLDPHGIRQLKEMMQEMKEQDASLLISTHLIESMEDNWNTTHIMKQGKILQSCHREDVQGTERLEDIYFRITEGDLAAGRVR